MKTTVISYSLTGNNSMLANNISSELNANHIKIEEPEPRTFGKIGMDMLFNRTPKISTNLNDIDTNDFIIFVAPVWMGKVAAPLRTCLKKFKNQINRYAFVSISGGADGPNPNLSKELQKRLKKSPEKVIDFHIAELLPQDPPPTREDTSSYQLNEQDAEKLTKRIIGELKEGHL